ncbi:MAG TPA: amino acid adenylation domain-containing protein [Gemmatimonadaceae bacterium]|nr:amino acid adenylation domain-containing protein [Gemmatimonadaceae bacterium]
MTAAAERRQRPESVAPLTPMQQGMLFHALLEPASRAYVVQIRCTLRGPLDAGALRRAWQHALDRHGMLRTAFAWQRAEGALQITWPHATVPWREVDWSEEPPGAADGRLDDLIESDRADGFDLARAPLFRITLVRLGAERHVLLWTMHHIILDGWSVARVLDEVIADYAGGAATQQAPRPFTDFVAWQSARSRADAEAYWRSALRGLEEPASPFGRSPGKAGVVRPADVFRTIDRERTRALAALGERARVTASTIALGAWTLVLSRTAGRADVMTGVTVAGRPPELAGVDAMVGLFINTLPFRARVDQNQGLDEWLRDVQRRSADLREHAHVALVDVQEWSGLTRTSPLFDHLFVFENYPVSAAAGAIGDLVVEDVRSVEPTEYPLTVVLVPGDEWSIQLAYDAARVPAADVERLADQFVTVLSSFATGDERALWEYEWLRDDERRCVTTTWNATATVWNDTVVPHEMFERQARITPNAPAVVFGTESVTYAELEARANQLAHHLIALGVVAESTVGIFMERSVDMVVAVLATLKAGAAYVPLDAAYPAERLAFMAADAGLAALLTQRALAPRAPAVSCGIIVVDDAREAIAAQTARPTDVAVDPGAALYVIYTSGSTGRPKGIVLSHGALGNLIRWHVDALRPAPHMLQFASLSFDASFHELFAAWATGGCAYLITDDQRHDVDALLHVVASHPIDRVILPVVVLQRWASQHGDELALFANLREIITTGEQLQITQPIVQLMRRLPRAELHNHYGPAETHVVTAHALGPDHEAWPTYPPVGAPIANTSAYVLDAWLRPVPVNVPGELYLGGANLARGYAGRPALTAEKFVPNPYGPPGSRLYRTGDQARWLPDGRLEYLGRLDLMVKIRGNRVELGEVEGALGSHPCVGSCAVAVHEHAPGDKRLVAYCVAADGARIDTSALRAHLTARVPDYMVPSAFVTLPALPLTPNGKIDRRALPAPDASRTTHARAVPPRDVVEEALVRAWTDVLGVSRVSAYDDFFELGGHSLTAVQVLARVRESFGVVPPLRALFDRPVLADFAAAVRDAMGSPGAPLAPIEPRAISSGPAPLSPAQERLYFLQRLDPESTAYNLSGRVRLDGALDLEACARALRTVVTRHDVLRTRFVNDDGVVRPRVDEPERFALRRIDLSMLDAATAQAELDRVSARELARPFDLDAEWPLRLVLLTLDPERHALSITLHHIAGDGASIEVFLREFADAYETALESATPDPTPQRLSFGDIAAHLRERDAQVDDAALAFWRDALRGIEPLELPTDRPRPAVSQFRGASTAWTLDAALSGAIDRLTRVAGCTPSVVFLSAFAELLRRYARANEAAIAMPVSLRDRPELERVIGLLLNTIVLRLPGSEESSVRQLLAATRDVLIDAFAHRDVPFERIVDAVRPARDRSRAPLAQVMFDYHAWRQDDVHAAGVRFAIEDVPANTTKFDLTLVVERRDDGYSLSLEYDVALFDPETAGAMRTHLDCLLRAFASDPASPMRTIAMTTASERDALVTWGRPVRTHGAPSSIIPMWDAACRSAPDHIALTDAAGSLSYGELSARVDALAAALRTAGIGRGSVVALQMDRSRALVVALLAVLRAGAAFVPLDPSTSEAYRRGIIEDASVALILTNDAFDPADVFAPSRRPVGDDAAASGDELAYVLYTSGSTGTPKGCQISHRALAEYVSWAARWYFADDRTEAGDCALFTALTFDLTLTSLFLPLVRGHTLTILPADAPATDLPALALRHADVVKLTPSHVMLLADAPPAPGVRVVIVGGEALAAEHVRILERVAPRAAIFNEYGPTEATVGCVVARVVGATQRILIGRPVDYASVAVVDACGRLVPAGVFGELLVGGPGLARGYARRSALSAERFVPDPWAREPGQRLYRTGDLARWTRSGELEYAGRGDDQLKVRGYRIEPEGIARVLETHPHVTRAAVVGDPPGVSPTRLVAYVVVTAPTQPRELREYLGGALPAYMVPALFVPVDDIPLTAHGKLDRRALPALDRAAATSAESVAPRTATEAALAEIWRELLHLDTVGVHDNFFELGGDSIVSMQMVSRAMSRGIAVDLDMVLRLQTIGAIAAAVDARATSGAAARSRARSIVTGPVPATPVARWFFEQRLANPNHFNQAALLNVADADPAIVERALNVLMRHHDALRLVAREDAGWSLEIVDPESARPVSLRVDDLSGLAPAARSAEIERRAAAAQATIDLAAGPPLVAVLFDCGAEEPARLLVAIHHLGVDAVSWRILLEDLEAVYASLLAGKPVRFPPKTDSIVEWGEAYAALAHETLPRETFAGWTPGAAHEAGLARALGHSGDADLIADECEVVVALDEAESVLLAQRARTAWDARIDDALLAALAVALRPRRPGGFTVDVEGHGRSPIRGVDCSRTVGWFTTIVPVRLPDAGDASPSALVRAVRDNLRGATARAHAYGALRYLHDDARVREHARALSDGAVLFNYHGDLDAATVAGGAFSVAAESPGPEKDPGGHRSHAIEITASITGGRVRIAWAFSRRCFDEASIRAFADAQVRALSAFVRDAGDPHNAGAAEAPSTTAVPAFAALADSELAALEAELLD